MLTRSPGHGARNSQRNPKTQGPAKSNNDSHHPKPQKRKTVAETDAELRERLEQMSGEGGEAGIELEDGQPNTMKRSVRNNMFRYI